jgi:hypothetical protein
MEMTQKMESSPSCHQGGGRQPLQCFIRRDASPWVQGRKHHEIALKTYLFLHVSPLDPGQTPTGAFICADHEDGGQFYAYFTCVNDTVYQFLDQYGKTVQIMMETPARIAYINRVTDC